MMAGPLAAQLNTGDGAFCAKLAVGSETVEPLDSGSTFSVLKTEDVRLLVLFLTPVKGDHILELKLMTPRGHHYQTLTAPIAVEPTEAGAERRVPTYPRPLEIQVLEPYQTRQGVLKGTELRLPVAGTSIMSSALYGEWEVEILLDGRPMDCERRNVFSIVE